MNNLSRKTETALAAIAVALLALLPLIVVDSYSRHILITIFIFALVAASWDLTLGYGGISNFGHLAFFGAGLYIYGVSATVFEVTPWIALLAAGLGASGLAALVTIPILRLKGIYVVLVTFGFSQLLMQIALSQSSITGGAQGMVRLPVLPFGEYNFIRDGRFGFYVMALSLLAIGIAAIRVYVRSNLGRSLVALRDSEEYAASRGVSTAVQRILAMSFSAFWAGIAGAFIGSYSRTASVEVFGMSYTTLILSMILVGGVGTTYGALLAAAVLVILSEALSSLGPYRLMIQAALIMVVMLLFPGGLVGGLGSITTTLSARLRRKGPQI